MTSTMKKPYIGSRGGLRPYLERATGRFVKIYRGNKWMVVLYEDGSRKRIPRATFNGGDDEYGDVEYEPQ